MVGGTTVAVRTVVQQDCATLARIWTAGWQQTIDLSAWYVKPLFAILAPLFIRSSLSDTGDIGPDGSRIVPFWTPPESNNRTMLVAELNGEVVGCIGVARGLAYDKEAEPSETVHLPPAVQHCAFGLFPHSAWSRAQH